MNMKRRQFLGLSVMGLTLAGCNQREDKRTTDEKLDAPQPDFKTRLYMACPKCGCPQRPYRITEIRNYYRCSGNPPKFPYHSEHQWQHAVDLKSPTRTEI
jgi:hypothetical protein